MSQVNHEPIKYQHPDFAIHHLIEDCPAHTVVRELLKNAEENAILLNPPGRIEWFTEERDGVPKLGLFNEGPGMSDEDLRRLMDMASTGKALGVDANFGQGGKVSALKVSPQGVIYRSCKGGKVCQIELAAERQPGVDYLIYVKRRTHIVDELADTWETVVDVTDTYRGRTNRSLDKEWTEVILLGKTADQDTVADLLPEATRTNWLIRQINQRFYRFPEGIIVRNADATSGQRNSRNAQGLEHVTLNWCRIGDGRHEDMPVEHAVYGPLTIRYCKLRGSAGVNDAEGNSRARTMEAYGIGTRGDHICLVWKNECYEVVTGWSRISGPFGVTFGSANIAIQILLPDSAPVKNNTYRDKLLRRDDSGHYVTLPEFADLVCQNRPPWLVEYVEEEARRNNTGSNVMDRLRQFLQELTVRGERRAIVEGNGDEEGERVRHRERPPGPGPNPNPVPPNPRPENGRRTGQHTPGIPQVQFTRDPAILGEMRGRAALYRRTENLVLLNPEHFRYQQDLNRLLEDVGPDAERRQLAQRIFDDEYMVQAGKYVVQAWLFRGRSEWDDNAFEEALGMGAMTVHLASPATLNEALRRYRQRMNTNRVPAAGSN
jgi:hypothetical protein